MNTKLLLALCILAFVVAALRFVPSVPLPRNAADFAGGMGVGMAIALAVIWVSQRTPRDS
jgi:hypothetical protein